MTEENVRGIDRAVSLAGSQHKLAEKLGVTQQAICRWVSKGYVPPARAVEIEAEYGVPRRELIATRLLDLLDLGATVGE